MIWNLRGLRIGAIREASQRVLAYVGHGFLHTAIATSNGEVTRGVIQRDHKEY